MYKDPIIAKIIDLLEAADLPGIKGIYNGDVVVPAKDDLPLIYVAKDTTAIGQADNLEDEHLLPMVATVIYDMTTDIGQSYDMVAGASSLYEIVEGRNDDYSLKPNTLAYVLRQNQVLDNKLWIAVGTPVTVNYGIGVNRRGPGTYSVEAVVRFTVRLHTPRAGL